MSATTEPWRAGARALARRWGTGDLAAAEHPDGSGRWLVTDRCGLRIYPADSVEVEALTAYRAAHGVPEHPGCSLAGVWPDGGLLVRVWRSGPSVMAVARDSWRHITAEAMVRLVEHALDRATTVVDGLTEYEGDRDLLVARDLYGDRLAYLAPALLASVADEGEVLLASGPNGNVVVIGGTGHPVGVVAPTWVREVAA